MIPNETGYYWARWVDNSGAKSDWLIVYVDVDEPYDITSTFSDWVGPLSPPISPTDIPCWSRDGIIEVIIKGI